MDRGGSITWYIDGDDSKFEATMRKVQAESAVASEAVDKDWKNATDRTDRNLSRFESIFRRSTKNVSKSVGEMDINNRRATRNISRDIARSVAESKTYLNDFYKQLSRSATNFRSFSIAARGFNMTSLIAGVVTATIAIIELGSAIAAAGGVIVALPSIITTVAGTLGVAKVATMGLSDAFKALADGDAEKVKEALDKLSPSARAFVLTVNDLKDEFKGLQLKTQEALFSGLDGTFRAIATTTLPVLEKGFTRIATSLNGMAKEAARVMAEPFFQKALADSFETTGNSLDILKKAIEPTFQALAGLLAVANPYVAKLSEWVVRQAQVFAAFTNSTEGQKKLTSAIDLGIQALYKLGDLVGSVFGLLVTLFKASEASGASLIDSLITIIDKLNMWLQTEDGQKQFTAMLENTRDTVIAVAGVLGQVAGILSTVATAFNGLPDPIKGVITQFLAWTLVLTPIATYLSGLIGSLKAVGGAVNTFAKILGVQKGFSMFIQGFKDSRVAASVFSGFMGTVGGVVRTALGAIGTAFSSVFGAIIPAAITAGKIALQGLGIAIRAIPVIGWIITIVSALVALFAYLYTNVEGFRNFVNGIGAFFVDVFNNVVGFFTGTVGPGIAGAFEAVETALGNVGNFFKTVWGAITTAVSTAVGAVINFLQPLIDVINGVIYVVTAIGTIIGTIFMGIMQVIGIVVSFIVQAIGLILYGIFLWLWNNVLTPTYNFFVTVFTNIWNFLVTVFQAIANTITTVWNAIVAFLMPIVQAIVDFVIGYFTFWYNTITAIMGFISTVITNVWNAIVGFITPIVQGIVNFVIGAFNNLKGAVQAAFGFIRDNIINPIATAVNFVAGKVGEIVTNIRNALTNAINTVTEFVGKMITAGKNMIDGLVKGVQQGKDAVVNKVKEIASGALDAIKNFFGIKSPSRVMAKMGDYMMEGLEKGIIRTGESVISASQGVAGSIASTFGALDGTSMNATVTGDIAGVNGASGAVGTNYLNETDNSGKIENHIGTITISDEVDAENWLQKLTRQDEVTRTGLTANV